LFGGLLKAEQFVAANLPSSYDQSVSFFFSPSEVAYSTYVVASIAVPCCLLIYALLLNTIHVVASICRTLLPTFSMLCLLNAIHVVASIAVPCCLLFVSCSLFLLLHFCA
jgi:hypothetical protein